MALFRQLVGQGEGISRAEQTADEDQRSSFRIAKLRVGDMQG